MSVLKQMKEFDIGGHLSVILDHSIRVCVTKKNTGELAMYVQYPDGISVMSEREYWQCHSTKRRSSHKTA